ncbi:hypothetical protein [Streptomyces sp. LN704]
MAHRTLLPLEALASLAVPEGLGPIYRRLFAEAAIRTDIHEQSRPPGS